MTHLSSSSSSSQLPAVVPADSDFRTDVFMVPGPAEAVVPPLGEGEPGLNGMDGETEPLLGRPVTAAVVGASREVLGLSFMALSALLFSLMSVLVKLSGNNFPFLEIVLVRSIVQFSLGVGGCIYVGVRPWGPAGFNRLWLIARGTAGATGLGLYFYTIVNMPLGDGMTIFFTGPAFTALLARVTLGEPLKPIDVLATLACLIGVVLVSRPEFIFHDSDHNHHQDADAPHHGGKHHATSPWAALAALGGALMSAVAYCLVRKIGTRAHYMVHVTYFGAMSTLISGVALFYTATPVPLPQWTLAETAMLLAVGVSAFIAQCFLNAGLQMAHAGPATLMRNLDIVFAFVFGSVFFGETPRVTSIVGAAIILASTASVALFKWWTHKRSL
ncbi:hypothetical protein PhCBS80983_g00895 [Powellomyces hirtus]|uniref:EamA domain-containing protein n=1 Tax=Powellomyces hirtus TaxID=109895 RepID=A0A507EEJ0_9FUNG|nr:hypothetical protein PhCBS80983_g00895 [Powellomyces hirtus]